MRNLMKRVQPERAAEDSIDRPNAIDTKRIGAYVRAMRERRGWRQADLARAAKVAPNTITGLESGRRTQAVSIDKIGAALGTTGEALRRGEFPDDADTLLKELTAEDFAIARMFHHSTTGVRAAVILILRSGRRDLTERIGYLQPDRQARLLRMLEAEEMSQAAEERSDRTSHLISGG